MEVGGRGWSRALAGRAVGCTASSGHRGRPVGTGRPAGSQPPAPWAAPRRWHMQLVRSALCWGSRWSGQVPEPACARPSPGARLPCQGTPVSGARRTVPVPWTWKSLTFQAAGAAWLGPVQLVSGGQGLGLTQQDPQGSEQSWQAARDLWKGLDGAQCWLLEFWTQLVGMWAGMSGLLGGALQLPPGRARGKVSPVGLGWEPTCMVTMWGRQAVEGREGPEWRSSLLRGHLRAGGSRTGHRNSCLICVPCPLSTAANECICREAREGAQGAVTEGIGGGWLPGPGSLSPSQAGPVPSRGPACPLPRPPTCRLGCL